MAVAAPATAEPDEDTEEEDSDMSDDNYSDFEDLEGPLEEGMDVAFNQLPWAEVPIPPRDQESLSEIRSVPGRLAGIAGVKQCESLTTALDFFLQLFTNSMLHKFVKSCRISEFTFLHFKETLIFQLCEEHVTVVQSDEPPAKRTRRLEACWSDLGSFSNQHFPENYDGLVPMLLLIQGENAKYASLRQVFFEWHVMLLFVY